MWGRASERCSYYQNHRVAFGVNYDSNQRTLGDWIIKEEAN